ncbi:MAG: aminotransferase class III [Bacteroidetes bacterium GWE2_29_8]|nr:MAG: aminotransferase class III [Bacteroidetes bacterium GWE2_29_8]OFY24502.1 MAG: aminotransferase class III [Bacteroidetes bacterium GWF2_29_10]
MITQRELFFKHVAQTSESPLTLEIDRAEGIYLYSKEKKYIDFISGISVSNVGHRHPDVVKAIKEQLDKYMHLIVYGEYIQYPQVKLAHKLSELLPQSLSSVYFVNSGSEANEGALKLAKRFTGRTEIIAFINSYHGSTHGALSVMGDEYFKSNFRPLLPNVNFIRYNHFDDLNVITKKTACVIFEPIQAEAGVIVPNNDYVVALSNRCKQMETLLICDEVQTGMGRTGKLWGFENYNIVPDIITLAKGLGGGLPLGAFISSKEVMDSLKDNPFLGHITTFGGNPVCCASALATLNIITQQSLIDNVNLISELILKTLKHNKIINLRGKGLLIAVEFETSEICRNVIKHCLEDGLITDWFLFADNCMRIAPPSIIKEHEAMEACKIILKNIDSAL